jgi:hypothetical protein
MSSTLLYKPLQYLAKYRYLRNGNLYIVASVKVELIYGEIIVIRTPNPVIPTGKYSVTLEFDVISNQIANGTYTFLIEVPILIQPPIVYNGSSGDPEETITDDVRAQLHKRMGSNDFAVTTIIYKSDKTKGGQVTSTIAKDEVIEII